MSISTALAPRARRASLWFALLAAIALVAGGCKTESTGKAPVKVPATAVAAGATPLAAGRAVYVEWNGEWFTAKVLKDAAAGKVKIHYDGWENQWDEEVPLGRVKLDAP
jgi:hypothetical protein